MRLLVSKRQRAGASIVTLPAPVFTTLV